MMDFLANHKNLAIGGVIGFVIVIALGAQIILSGNSSKNTPSSDPFAVTSFYSSITKANDSLTVNYGGSAESNHDAATGQFRVFAVSSLPMPQTIKDQLPALLQGALAARVTPTYAVTYVQITRSSISCATQYDCKFSFYLDSPESYYDFHIFNQADGSQAYSLRQEPLPGVIK